MVKSSNRLSGKNVLFIMTIIFIVILVVIFQTNRSKKIKELRLKIDYLNAIQEKVYDIRNQYILWEEYDPNLQGNYYDYIKQFDFKNANTASLNPYSEEFKKILLQMDENKKLEYFNHNIDNNLANYYYFDSDEILKEFNIETDTDMYLIINFYTGNIVTKDPIEDVYSGKMIYQAYESSLGEKLKINKIFEDLDLKLEVIKNYGLKQDIKITFPKDESNISIKETYYYLNDESENKINCSNLDNYKVDSNNKEITFTITKSGNYTFVVTNQNNIDYKKIEKTITLVNKPELLSGMVGIYFDEYGNEKEIADEFDSNWYDYSKDVLKMANAKTADGNYYVWIPRYKYKENPDGTLNIEYLENETNIPTSMNTALQYKLQDSFKQASKGFWVAKFVSTSNEFVDIKPGKLYSSVIEKQAEKICEQYFAEDENIISSLISKENIDAILNISRFSNIEIDDTFEIYAGGSENENAFKENYKYSSTGNVYGVYDLKNIAYEQLLNQHVTTNGGFRNILFKR